MRVQKLYIILLLVFPPLSSCKVRLSDSTPSTLNIVSKADNVDLIAAFKMSIEALIRLNTQFEVAKFMKGIGVTEQYFDVQTLNDRITHADRTPSGFDGMRMAKGTNPFIVSWSDSGKQSHSLFVNVTRDANESLVIDATKLVLRVRQPTSVTYKATDVSQEFTGPLDKLIVRIDVDGEKHHLSAFFQNTNIYYNNKWQKIIPNFNQNIRDYNISCPMIGGEKPFINEMWLIKEEGHRKIGFEIDKWAINNFDTTYKEQDFKNDAIKVDFGKWESFKLTPEIAKSILNKHFREKTKKAGKFEIVGECTSKDD